MSEAQSKSNEKGVDYISERLLKLVYLDTVNTLDKDGREVNISIDDHIKKGFDSTIDSISEATGISKEKVGPKEREALKKSYCTSERDRYDTIQVNAKKFLSDHFGPLAKEFDIAIQQKSVDTTKKKEDLCKGFSQLLGSEMKKLSDDELNKLSNEILAIYELPEKANSSYVAQRGKIHSELAKSFDQDDIPNNSSKETDEIVAKLLNAGAVFADSYGAFVPPSKPNEKTIILE